MHYQNVRAAKFIDRPNRFIAHVELDGSVETVHVKNTGRCRELLVPGCTVYLEKGTNPNRKTAYDLIAVEKGSILINMDAQAPNKVFAEWAAAGGFLPDVTAIRPEYAYGGSRLDFCIETKERLHLVEVKGVTLEENGNALFPDAPTERGVKHIRLKLKIRQFLVNTIVKSRIRRRKICGSTCAQKIGPVPRSTVRPRASFEIIQYFIRCRFCQQMMCHCCHDITSQA